VRVLLPMNRYVARLGVCNPAPAPPHTTSVGVVSFIPNVVHLSSSQDPLLAAFGPLVATSTEAELLLVLRATKLPDGHKVRTKCPRLLPKCAHSLLCARACRPVTMLTQADLYRWLDVLDRFDTVLHTARRHLHHLDRPTMVLPSSPALSPATSAAPPSDTATNTAGALGDLVAEILRVTRALLRHGSHVIVYNSIEVRAFDLSTSFSCEWCVHLPQHVHVAIPLHSMSLNC
jgi:hypothetical protein